MFTDTSVDEKEETLVTCMVCYERDAVLDGVVYNGDAYSICDECLARKALLPLVIEALENKIASIEAVLEEASDDDEQGQA